MLHRTTQLILQAYDALSRQRASKGEMFVQSKMQGMRSKSQSTDFCFLSFCRKALDLRLGAFSVPAPPPDSLALSISISLQLSLKFASQIVANAQCEPLGCRPILHDGDDE